MVNNVCLLWPPMIEKKPAIAVNNGEKKEQNFIIEVAFCHYLVTPLYTEAPLENPLLFLSKFEQSNHFFSPLFSFSLSLIKDCKMANTFSNWLQILAWSCASSLQALSHKCSTNILFCLFEKKVEILQIQTLQNKWLIFFVHTNLG